MASNTTEAARQELIREYIRRYKELQLEIDKKLRAMDPTGQKFRNLYTYVHDVLTQGFSSGKYSKPSQCLAGEMSWIFGMAVPERFRPVVLEMADRMLEYPYSTGWTRRSFRSEQYRSYGETIARMVSNFGYQRTVDADICDILTGNLPEDALAYLRRDPALSNGGFAPELLAYELDRGNSALEAIITEIINGEGSFAAVSHSLIQGIIKSRNQRMHQLLCRLLLAARLQEGLRQAICENADCGTKEAFLSLAATIEENNLMRYSSVKRAVGTWLGLLSEEQRDLERVSNKSISLIQKCLADKNFREECLASEDSMQIYIALWSHAFDSAEQASGILEALAENGTHHQVLTAGYFVGNLNNQLLAHTAARKVLTRHRERYDILAVYLPHFIPYPRFVLSRLFNKEPDPNIRFYFDSNREGAEFCDWLMALHGSIAKREMLFSPCIFPWHSAALKKSDIIERAIVIAVVTADQPRIDALCPYVADCDAGSREMFLRGLAMYRKTPAVRSAILRGLADKAERTRYQAMALCKGLMLTQEEYLQIEDMLRLRYEDLRRNVMELLLKQPEAQLEQTLERLLSSSKTQMRTAALDMLAQMSKQPLRKELAQRCMPYVDKIANPTTQEQILISALTPKRTAAAEPLFTDSDRYVPVVSVDDDLRRSLELFTQYFPDSKLEKQVLAGKHVTVKPKLLKPKTCSGAEEAARLIEDLSGFYTENKQEIYTDLLGQSRPLGTNTQQFMVWNPETGEREPPRMDLWNRWFLERKVNKYQLLTMHVLLSAHNPDMAYLRSCGMYLGEIYGSGFEVPASGNYMNHIRFIVETLINREIPGEERLQLAVALGAWVSVCLPEDMLLGSKGLPLLQVPAALPMLFGPSEERKNELLLRYRLQGNPVGHFIAHPQMLCLLTWMKVKRSEYDRILIPVMLCMYERSFAAADAFMQTHMGEAYRGHSTLVLDQIYNDKRLSAASLQKPSASTYLYACHYGVFSERTLYYYLMDPVRLKDALDLVTSVCAMQPREGSVISSRGYTGQWTGRMRREYQKLVGDDRELSDQQQELIDLCHRVAEKLVSAVLEAELLRGDTPAQYSLAVRGIRSLSGGELFVRILSALGRETLDRSVYYWGSSDSKRGNLSWLLSVCEPGAKDTAETLGRLLKGTDISEKRLIEAALYSPAWIDLIGEYLQLPGFKSACYYFMAHMNERFDDQKKAIIARFSPLTEDELNDGAFDMVWFRAAYEQLGEKRFDMIYDAAKYISDGSKHTRARKFADAALGRLSVTETQNAIGDKRNKDLLIAYAIIPLEGEEDLVHRYLYLQQFRKESRQFGAQRIASEKKAVDAALRNLATNAGFSDTMRLTLRMETKLVEDSAELFTDQAVGDWVFRLQIDERGAAEVLCSKDGKLLKSIPPKAKKDAYVARLLDMKKQLTEQYRRTRRMFEEAMEDGSGFTLEELSRLSGNPVVRPILSKLVFKSEDKLGLFDGEKLTALDGAALETAPDATLTVAHPVHLYQSGRWTAFQQYLFDEKLAQPFKQVFRELYVKTADELGQFRSLRYAGNQIQPKKAAACLKERRWVADVEAGLQKVYYKENIVATIYAMADWFTPADIEAPTLEYVAFFHRKTNEPLKIDEIPDVIFSEVMRDVDLAVSVAHAGGVDPETSHSTVEMRAAILGFTLPLLRLNNVEIKNSHAFIRGKLAEYSVHLGSGVVHQLGGTMLSVLPVHSQHRGRFFLPFVDEDPKTAEIISKVILFSEDSKLKDPTILSQITR